MSSISERAAQILSSLNSSSEAWAQEDENLLSATQALVQADAEVNSGAGSARLFEAASSCLQRRAVLLDGAATVRSESAPLLAEFSESQVPSILSESLHFWVLWKPPGWAAGESLGEDAEVEDGSRRLGSWIKEQLGPFSTMASNAAVGSGLVHRLDTETSGALLCAKNYKGFFQAKMEFAGRRVLKVYTCLCHGWLDEAPPLLIERRLLRQQLSESQWITRVSDAGAFASTEVLSAEHFWGPLGEPVSLLGILLHTGRTHQIRAHMSSLGYPLVGDTLYGGAHPPWCPRTFLHARRLRLNFPEFVGGSQGWPTIDVEVPLPADLEAAIRQLQRPEP